MNIFMDKLLVLKTSFSRKFVIIFEASCQVQMELDSMKLG
jgi:hypothetical protein